MFLETKEQRQDFIEGTLCTIFCIGVWSFIIFMVWGVGQTSYKNHNWLNDHNYLYVYLAITVWAFIIISAITIFILLCGGLSNLVNRWVDNGADQTKKQAREELVRNMTKNV